MSKINKTTKLKQLKLEYPKVKAWVDEHDIWSPNEMPDGYYWTGGKSGTRTSFYYLIQRIMSEVGIMELFNKEKQRYSTLCYIREELNNMGHIVPSIKSLNTYANDLVAPAPAKGSKKTGRIGGVQGFEPKRIQLNKALLNSKAFAKR